MSSWRTLSNHKGVLADHGMVVLFQPYTGRWTQILGVFASKGNVQAATLAKIIVECTVLAERAGLYVDSVTCDGASWNRSMWRIFGIHVLFPKSADGCRTNWNYLVNYPAARDGKFYKVLLACDIGGCSHCVRRQTCGNKTDVAFRCITLSEPPCSEWLSAVPRRHCSKQPKNIRVHSLHFRADDCEFDPNLGNGFDVPFRAVICWY
ncbi:hypothetical protein HPB51_025147 [Rhipicephalus microplus]|uniref:Transposable element P transposase-like RNase H domain-containing protein n=1 Tax=Rhipicephalus microplus TaxID=6941 RepID=A0A9J6DRM8_RHIMP|nr:hypothetical protein HPB51_025147 [Rhipicephalus microplus]